MILHYGNTKQKAKARGNIFPFISTVLKLNWLNFCIELNIFHLEGRSVKSSDFKWTVGFASGSLTDQESSKPLPQYFHTMKILLQPASNFTASQFAYLNYTLKICTLFGKKKCRCFWECRRVGMFWNILPHHNWMGFNGLLCLFQNCPHVSKSLKS